MKLNSIFSSLLVLGLVASITACTDIDLNNTTATEAPTQLNVLTGDFSRTLIVDDKLYGVDQQSIITYDISVPEKPVYVDRTPVGRSIETIYHDQGNLFIGSREGMYIYTISRNGVPVRRGDYQYAELPGLETEPCDPVVAEGNTAFASLYASTNNSNPCGQTTEALETIVVLDVSSLENPTLVQMHDTPSPRGLAIQNSILFVCNNENGLRVFDVSDRENFELLDHVSDINAWDVTIVGNRLVVAGLTEVVQYDFSDPSNLVLLSRFDYPQS